MMRPCVRLVPYLSCDFHPSDHRKFMSRIPSVSGHQGYQGPKPIADFELYAHTRKIAQDESFSPAVEQAMRERHPCPCPMDIQETPTSGTTGKRIPDDPLDAVVHFRISETGYVKVKVCVPMETVYEKNRHLKKPSIKEMMVAMTQFGYSTESIQTMYKKALKRERNAMDCVEVDMKPSKKSKTKRGTVYYEISTRLGFKLKAEVHDIFEKVEAAEVVQAPEVIIEQPELFGEIDDEFDIENTPL